MEEFNLALLTLAALVFAAGLSADYLRRRVPLSEPLLAVLVGAVLGPAMLGWLRPERWGKPHALLEEVARLTLGLTLMAVALRLPTRALRAEKTALVWMLGLALPLTWLASSLLVLAFTKLGWWRAALVGAVFTPTDPVLASSVVTGRLAERLVPARLRWLLSAESGANDGLAYPLALLPVLLLARPAGEALWTWLGRVVLWKVAAAALLGGALGFLAARLFRRGSSASGGPPAYLASVLSLALLVLAGTKLLGMDGLFAVFASGVTFRAAIGERQENAALDALNRFSVLGTFAFFGMLLPWAAWRELGWAALGLPLAVLVLRRLPFVLALRRVISPLRRLADAAFVGWFGPIGVGALFYATLGERLLGDSRVWTLGSLLVAASVLLHGVSALPLTVWYGRQGQRPAQAHAQKS